MRVANIPIDVLTWTDKDGNIHPVRFRMSEEDEYKVIKVKVLSSEKIKQAGQYIICYRCQSVIDYIEKVFELRYIVMEHKWVLWKI